MQELEDESHIGVPDGSCNHWLVKVKEAIERAAHNICTSPITAQRECWDTVEVVVFDVDESDFLVDQNGGSRTLFLQTQ